METKNFEETPSEVDPEQLTSKELADLQQQDSTMKMCFALASLGQGFERTNGVLYRKIETRLDNEEITQLVASKPCRKFVLRVAHDSSMSGHTGVTLVRTLDRIIHSFFWPGVRQDVKRCVRTCEPCQLVVRMKPKQRVPI